jgi:SAM-dependent methyltransferase
VTLPAFHRQLRSALGGWWEQQSQQKGRVAASARLAYELWAFLRDSTPDCRRSRYGDMEYDWEHRVNTTSGSVGWRERLLGVFHSPYQPTDAGLFAEMMVGLPIDFDRFTFIDLGSGKGRTLLMASQYPFRRIVGVELIAGLHQIALENLSIYKSDSQKCFALEAICGDAADFAFPEEPLVLYLFNPLPESGLKRVMASLQNSLSAHPRPVYVLYHNPLLERVLSQSAALRKVRGTHRFSLYADRITAVQK